MGSHDMMTINNDAKTSKKNISPRAQQHQRASQKLVDSFKKKESPFEKGFFNDFVFLKHTQIYTHFKNIE